MSQELDENETAQEAQAAIREGIERARELLCEAKLRAAQQEAAEGAPPKGRPGLPLG